MEPPELNYDFYIITDDWAGTQHVKNSPILQIVNRLVQWIPVDVHRQSLQTIMEKYQSSGSGYNYGTPKDKRLSRTNHAQVLAIVTRHLAAIHERAVQAITDPARLEQFEKELSEGLSVANLIETECERRAEARRRKVQDGNITWVTIPAEKGKA